MLKNFPIYDKTVEEFFSEISDEIDRCTGHRLEEVNGVRCVNFCRRADQTLSPPGVLVIQCRTIEIKDWWWEMITNVKGPIMAFHRQMWTEVSNSGSRPQSNFEYILRSPRHGNVMTE